MGYEGKTGGGYKVMSLKEIGKLRKLNLIFRMTYIINGHGLPKRLIKHWWNLRKKPVNTWLKTS